MLTLPGAIEAFLAPVTVLVWLFAIVAWLRQLDDPRFAVAVVLVFTLTYPGNLALTDTPGKILGKSLLTSVTVLTGLTLFAYASSWLRSAPYHELLPWLAALPLVLFGSQRIARSALPGLLEYTDSQASVVVCGVNDVGARLATHFQRNPAYGMRFVGFFDDRACNRLSQIGRSPLLGNFRDLSNFVRINRVDRIYLALPMATQPRILQMLEELRDTTASVYFAPDIFITDIINGRMESVAGIPTVAVRETPFAGFNSVVKRAEDLVLASIALIASAPAFALIALSIGLSSPGPILFAQRRYGLDGHEIGVYKFRTMSVVEDGVSAFTPVQAGDGRVTPLGRFLRRTSLDELPQLINVLQGNMSLVGPRPHAVAMNEQFRRLIPGYMLRHKIKPGITGLAQVRGLRGGDDLGQMTRRIGSDLEYLRNWTLGLDLVILARTLPILFKKHDAY